MEPLYVMNAALDAVYEVLDEPGWEQQPAVEEERRYEEEFETLTASICEHLEAVQAVLRKLRALPDFSCLDR